MNSVSFDGRTYPIEATVMSAAVNSVKDQPTNKTVQKVVMGAGRCDRRPDHRRKHEGDRASAAGAAGVPRRRRRRRTIGVRRRRQHRADVDGAGNRKGTEVIPSEAGDLDRGELHSPRPRTRCA